MTTKQRDDDEELRLGSYLTREGAERLQRELQQLLNGERPKVTAEVSAAAAQGDRSENAEYIYGKKRLREIDRRIRFLQNVLDHSSIVDTRIQTATDRVYFGAVVQLRNESDGSEVRYQLVGAHEVDALENRISIHSPIGRGLLGRRVGDVVRVARPKGEVEFTVLSIGKA